jgi:hypothetical protein
MDNLTKVLVAIVTVGMITTAVLPGRQTSKVIDSASKFFSGALGTAMASGVKK